MVQPIQCPEYGLRIKKLLETLGYQQVELVRMLAPITQASLSHAIRGRNMLSNETHLKLADKTGVNLHWLLTGEGSMLIRKGGRSVNWAKVEEYLDQAKEEIRRGREHPIRSVL
jgi:hypothetical protein